jgi:arginine-tRNA-protein transferase
MYNRIVEFSTLDDECPYIDGKKQRVHYKYINSCSKKYAHKLTSIGYRRFGNFFSRPICPTCDECKSIRIDATEYKFSKSARRVIRKNQDTIVLVQKPTISQEHIDLYNKFHKFKESKSGWNFNKTNYENYFSSFVEGHKDYGKEVLYFDGDKLIAVDLIDIFDDGISSIYFYYDPDYMHLSLGKYSLYKQIEIANRLDIEWIYLGYYVKDCSSLKYKGEYKPYQTLKGRPKESEDEIWEFLKEGRE